MSVLLELNVGDVVIDLHADGPHAAHARNFAALCGTGYYTGCLLYNVVVNSHVQTGDPTGTGRGGECAASHAGGSGDRFYAASVGDPPKRRHDAKGLVSMVAAGKTKAGSERQYGSQFLFTMRGDDLAHLDEQHCVFGAVAEGLEVLDAVNGEFIDDDGRPCVIVLLLLLLLLLLLGCASAAPATTALPPTRCHTATTT